MSKIIYLNKFQKKDNPLDNLSANSDCYVARKQSSGYMLSEETSVYISNNDLVSFIIDYGIKVQESDSGNPAKRMIKHHKCIMFYGINYYLKFDEFDKKKQRIYDYLDKNYSVQNV